MTLPDTVLTGITIWQLGKIAQAYVGNRRPRRDDYDNIADMESYR